MNRNTASFWRSLMPEMWFEVRWPDGSSETCYSPSLVIQDYFREDQAYPVADFLERSRTALQIASDRVKAKYGRPCSLALCQLSSIEATVARFERDPDATVLCERFLNEVDR
jgi:uncharacterized repeat protein (TIGR04042 family)